MEKFCTKCGKQCDDQTTYCPSCGTVLQMSDEAKKKFIMKQIISGVIWIFVMGLILLFLDITNQLDGIVKAIQYVLHG